MLMMMMMICSITAAYLLSHVFRDASMQSSTSALGRMNGMMSSSVASATRPSPDTNNSIHCEYPNPACKTQDTARSKNSREGEANCLCTFLIYLFVYLFLLRLMIKINFNCLWHNFFNVAAATYCNVDKESKPRAKSGYFCQQII